MLITDKKCIRLFCNFQQFSCKKNYNSPFLERKFVLKIRQYECQIPKNLCWFQIWRNVSKKMHQKDSQKNLSKKSPVPTKNVFGFKFFLVHFVLKTFLQIWNQHKIMDILTPKLTYFEGNKFAPRRDYCIFITKNTKSAIHMLKITNNVYVSVLGSHLLSKMHERSAGWKLPAH